MDKMDALLWKLARRIAEVYNELYDYTNHLAQELDKDEEHFDFDEVKYWTQRRNGVRRELDDLCELVGLPRFCVVEAYKMYREENNVEETFVTVRELIDKALKGEFSYE